VDYYQSNWSEAIPALDVAQLGMPHESTGISPHEVLRGFKMTYQFDWSRRSDLEKDMPRKEKVDRAEAQQIAETIQGYMDFARRQISAAQEKQALQANKHRREPDFDVDDRVFIIKKNSATNGRPADKLDFPLTQQHFRIKSRVGYNYELDVPDNWTGSRVFHADRLRKFPTNPLPGQEMPQRDGEVVDERTGDEEYEVERVLASRLFYNKLQYQVQWKDWDPDPNWYYAGDFKNSPRLLKEFHNRYPERAGPPVRLKEWMDAANSETFDDDHPDDNLPAPRDDAVPRRSGRRRG
jgi:hypothetical protein